MYNLAIIGTGQLGSRHLQAIKTASSPLSIWVLDNNDESLKIASQRYDEIPAIGEKTVNFVSSMESIPSKLDLVVIATGSKPRASLVKSLLGHSEVSYLILEKVLFSKLSDYDEIDSILKVHHVRTWVNCPRRMFGMYQEVKRLLDDSLPIEMIYEGENWGLCCNSIHMIDIFMYLTGETNYSIDVSGLDPAIEESKRPGYIEMTGSVRVQTPQGSSLMLTSKNGFKGHSGMSIKNGDNTVFIDELSGQWEFNGEKKKYSLPYQSQLTGILVDEILKTGGCMLTPFETSSLYHKPFMEAFLGKYNELTNNKDNKELPIT